MPSLDIKSREEGTYRKQRKMSLARNQNKTVKTKKDTLQIGNKSGEQKRDIFSPVKGRTLPVPPAPIPTFDKKFLSADVLNQLVKDVIEHNDEENNSSNSTGEDKGEDEKKPKAKENSEKEKEAKEKPKTSQANLDGKDKVGKEKDAKEKRKNSNESDKNSKQAKDDKNVRFARTEVALREILGLSTFQPRIPTPFEHVPNKPKGQSKLGRLVADGTKQQFEKNEIKNKENQQKLGAIDRDYLLLDDDDDDKLAEIGEKRDNKLPPILNKQGSLARMNHDHIPARIKDGDTIPDKAKEELPKTNKWSTKILKASSEEKKKQDPKGERTESSMDMATIAKQKIFAHRYIARKAMVKNFSKYKDIPKKPGFSKGRERLRNAANASKIASSMITSTRKKELGRGWGRLTHGRWKITNAQHMTRLKWSRTIYSMQVIGIAIGLK